MNCSTKLQNNSPQHLFEVSIKICIALLSPEFIVGPNTPWYVMDIILKIQFSKRKYSIQFTAPSFKVMVDSHCAIDDSAVAAY